MRQSAIRSRGPESADDHIAGQITAAEHTRVPMLFSDPNLPGNPIVYANDSFLTLTGYVREEVLGKTCHFLMGAETEPEARSQIDTLFVSGFYEGCPEVRCYHKDGSSFWTIVFVGPVLDPDGHVARHFVSFMTSPSVGVRSAGT